MYQPDSPSVSPWINRRRTAAPINQMALNGLLEDIVSVVTPGVQAGSAVLKDKTATFVTELIQSSEFKKVLDQVKGKAEEAVTDKVKENAFILLSLSVIGGVVGGTIFRGPIGVAIAGGLAGLGAFVVLKPPKLPPKKK